jgi:hypothetical protein
MKRSLARVRGLGFIIWHSRHELYHVLLGLIWAWFLREKWGLFNPKWIWISIFGSLLPDADHLVFFLTYGKRSNYTKQIVDFLKTKQWRTVAVFIEKGHKDNTNLYSHNYYTVAMVILIGFIASFYDWQSGVVFFGSIAIHYFFDIFDDLAQLGGINENWTRWGRPKRVNS